MGIGGAFAIIPYSEMCVLEGVKLGVVGVEVALWGLLRGGREMRSSQVCFFLSE